MKRMTLVLDRVLLQQAIRVLGVKTYSAAVNLAMAEVLRFRKIQGLEPRFSAAGRSGHHDTAKRAEELLWRNRPPRDSDSRKRIGKGRKEPLSRQ